MQHKADSIELEDPRQAGVYVVTAADLETVARAPHPDSTRLLRMDLSACTDRAALFESMGDAFELDAEALRGWDDLADALGDLAGLPAQGYILLVSGAQGLREARPADFETLLDVLDEASASWAAAEIPFFSFIALPEPGMAGTGPVEAEDFRLRGAYVELNQLLKLAGLCESGGAGKALVASGAVRVDGRVELRKTCKIRANQVVQVGRHEIRVHAGDAD